MIQKPIGYSISGIQSANDAMEETAQ